MNRLYAWLAGWTGLLSLVGALGAEAVDGPRRWTINLKPREFVTYEIDFRAGKTAIFSLIGQGNTDVDVHVFAPGQKNAFISDIAVTDIAYAKWTVPAGKNIRYLIKVTNLGEEANKLTVGHN